MDTSAPSLFSALPQGVAGASLSPAAAPELRVSFSITRQVTEGKSGQGSLRFKDPLKQKTVFKIRLNPQNGQISVPASVTVPAGASSAKFDYAVKDDKLVNLTREAELAVYLGNQVLATNRLTIVDNEKPPVLKLVLPTQLIEGKAQSTGSIILNQPAATDFNVQLKSDPENQLDVSTILVRAGVKTVKFQIGATDDFVSEGKMAVKVSTVSKGLVPASAVTTIVNNGSKILRLTMPGILADGSRSTGTVAVPTRLSKDLVVVLNSDGADYLGYPSSVTIPAGKASASFTVEARDHAVLDEFHTVSTTATAASYAKSTAKTDVHETAAAGRARTLPLATNDLIWDGANGSIYASVPSSAGPPYGNHVIAIDPATLEITASVPVYQEPGQLALTSGGEALYVARNGNGTVSKIMLPDFTVASSFAIGTDPTYGTLYADDISIVAGQPDLLVVARYRKGVIPKHAGVAAYDHGIRRPIATRDHTGGTRLEPSADPSIFFGYDGDSTESGLRRLQIGPEGVTELVMNRDLLPESQNGVRDIRSDGDTVFNGTGTVVDGKNMRSLGSLPYGGLVCPDLVKGRVYSLKIADKWATSSKQIVAYDSTTFVALHEVSLKNTADLPESFIRWGDSGLAFRSGGRVIVVENSYLVPSKPAADLAVTLVAKPGVAAVGKPLTYSVTVKNKGSNIAYGAVLSAVLSKGQTVSSVSASDGVPYISGLKVSVSAGNLAPGQQKTLTVVTSPGESGAFTCVGSGYSQSVDPVSSDNTAFKVVYVDLQKGVNQGYMLRLGANGLIYDPLRAVLWVTIPSSVGAPLGKSLISINPQTGAVSDPVPLGGNPRDESMALSGNGRYLYVGLQDDPSVERVDLATSGHPKLRIPLGEGRYGGTNHAQDIEVLDGDGTSFIVSGYSENLAMVFDGAVRRPKITEFGSVGRIERGEKAGVYISYSPSSTYLTRLSVDSTGVTVRTDQTGRLSGADIDIDTSGGLLLAGNGSLMDLKTLKLIASLGMEGAPCVDSANKRAYLVKHSMLRIFETTKGGYINGWDLPYELQEARKCVRWGVDGFGILSTDGSLHIVRWSGANPGAAAPVVENLALADVQSAWAVAAQAVMTMAVETTGRQLAEWVRTPRVTGADADTDGTPDELEIWFGASPWIFTADPLTETETAEKGTRIIRWKFALPTRTRMPRYEYEISYDDTSWSVLAGVEESVVSEPQADGSVIMMVEASARVPLVEKCFVRLRGNPQGRPE